MAKSALVGYMLYSEIRRARKPDEPMTRAAYIALCCCFIIYGTDDDKHLRAVTAVGVGGQLQAVMMAKIMWLMSEVSGPRDDDSSYP